jgi:hypothetical protein
MPKVFLNSKDVLKEIYREEEAGDISSSEDEDQLELNLFREDDENDLSFSDNCVINTANYETNLDLNQTIPNSESKMSIATSVTDKIKLPSINNCEKIVSIPTSESKMYITSIIAIQDQPALKANLEIPTSKFFRSPPPVPYQKSVEIQKRFSNFIRNNFNTSSAKSPALLKAKCKIRKCNSFNSNKKSTPFPKVRNFQYIRIRILIYPFFFVP